MRRRTEEAPTIAGVVRRHAYLAGPMRGIEEWNRPAFNVAAAALRERWPAVEMFNPGERTHHDDHEESHAWRLYMSEDVAWILAVADMMVVLPGWRESLGARIEVAVAGILGLPILSYAADCELPGAGRESLLLLLGHLTPAAATLAPSRTVLEEAGRLVDGGERARAYGPPRPMYERVARVWSGILATDVTPEQAVLCLAGMKLVREAITPRRDNPVDLAGYARVYERLSEGVVPGS